MIDFVKIAIISVWAWALSYFQPILGVAMVFLAFFCVDFATGLLASFSRGYKFRSWKARESFFKLLVYLGCFGIVIAFGREIQKVDPAGADYNTMIGVLKIIIYIAVWFEAKSNAENLRIMFPKNRFVAFLDYILGVEFVNKLPWLKNFLDKENKDDPGC